MEYAYCLDPDRQIEKVINLREPINIYMENAFGGKAGNEGELLELMNKEKHHPLVGPIYINGVEAGMNIEVELINIQPDSVGYQCCSRTSGVIKLDPFSRNFQKILYSEGMIDFDGLLMKANPSIGVIGTATKILTRSGRLGNNGGNIDLKELSIGSKIILPCGYNGALLYLGDMHMLQGNGEVSGIAAEASGILTFSVNIAKYTYNFPIIDTNDQLVFVGYGDDIKESVRKAVENAIFFLESQYEMKYVKAYMLLSLIGNVILGHSTGKVVSSGIGILKSQLNYMKGEYIL